MSTEIRVDAENFKAVRVTAHDDGVTVEFGYAFTIVEPPNLKRLSNLERIAQRKYIDGKFQVCEGTPARAYKTASGAERAVAKWLGRYGERPSDVARA